MNHLLITQRVVVDISTGERRDALDSRWSPFLGACGYLQFPVPNRPETAAAYFDAVQPKGLILSGGNDLISLGGDSPERDSTESILFDEAVLRGLPILGICRGMQFIQTRYGISLAQVPHHVKHERQFEHSGRLRSVVCFHRYGARSSVPPLHVDAVAEDGVIEAVSVGQATRGIMWHPERSPIPDPSDIALVQELFQ